MKKAVFIFFLFPCLYSCQNQQLVDKEYFKDNPPNIILVMADDLGWGDTGYNGNPVIKTPNLDQMASEGLVFSRFYASSPVCSPTRGSCLTGRHPYRYGIFSANVAHIPKEELLLSEILKGRGYVTGHFGKWHLGTLTKDIEDSNRGGKDHPDHFAPPWENGFDECFSTEAKVPTYNPMLTPIGWNGNTDQNKPFGTYYWDKNGELITQDLAGDDSEIIMDRAIPFIEEAIDGGNPFFAVIWFHAPHLPVLADSLHRAMYAEYSNEEQNYYGCITALDEQVGRLRKVLDEMQASENTMIWFTSDNGPEGRFQDQDFPGSAGNLRGRKRSLYEGGIRVPGILSWPILIKESKLSKIPCSTLDYLPTILDILGEDLTSYKRKLDGISLFPFIKEEIEYRSHPIYFESGNQVSLINDQYKLYSKDNGENFELFDLLKDPEEKWDISNEKPELVKDFNSMLLEWQESCKNSLSGADY
jgi:arylsulfatase A-like enzyme